MQIAAIIAVLKLNATYLPVHHDTPDRIERMLEIAKCKTILTDCGFTRTSTVQALHPNEVLLCNSVC